MLFLTTLLALFSCNTIRNQEIVPVSAAFQKEMLQLVNDQRAAGCTCGNEYFGPAKPLVWNPLLESAASRHATDMHTNSFFDHKGSDGTRIADRLNDAHYEWQAVGENIAFGYDNMEEAVSAWINSPTHCELLMSPNFSEMGAAQSGLYWVQTFGNPLN